MSSGHVSQFHPLLTPLPYSLEDERSRRLPGFLPILAVLVRFLRPRGQPVPVARQARHQDRLHERRAQRVDLRVRLPVRVPRHVIRDDT